MTTKPSLHYWFCRIYAAVVWLGVACTMLPAVYFGMRDGDGRLFGWCAVAWLPFYSLATLLILNRFVFPWRYSVLGRYRRTPLPNEPTLAVFYASYGRFARLNCTVPMVMWIVYRSGLGIKIALFGNAYIPARDIVSLSFNRWTGCIMEHDSAEIRSPILLPTKVAQAIEGIVLPTRVIPYAEPL